MALDTSIPLQGKPVEMPDWMSLAQKHQSILNARAQEQNALLEAEQRRTQMPGIAAETAGRVRTNRLQQIQEEEAQNPAHLNPDGTVNEASFAQAVFRRGAVSASQDVQAKTAANRAALAQAKTAEFKAEIDAKTPAFQDWLTKNQNLYAEQDPKQPGKITHNLPALQRAASEAGFPMHAMEFGKLHLEQVKGEADAAKSKDEAIIKSLATVAEGKKLLADIYDNIKDPVLQNTAVTGFIKAHPELGFLAGVPDKNGDFKPMSPSEIRAAKAGVQTPEQQAMTAEVHENAQAQRAAAYAGVAQIAQNIQAFKEGTLSPIERAQFKLTGETHFADAGALANGVAALQKWTKTGSNALNQPVQMLFGKATDSNEQAAWSAARSIYSQRTGREMPLTTTANEALALLQNEQQKAAGLAEKIDRAVTSPGKTPEARVPKTNPALVAPAPAVRMKSPTGVWGTVKPADVERAKAKGYTE